MKSRFILFRRAGVFYAEETATGKQTSLRTKDEGEAITLLNTKNEATRQPAMNLQIAQVYLQHADATMAQRTWQNVMDAMFPLKTGPTQARWQSAMRDKAYDTIRSRKLIETASEHFLQVLNAGTISTNMFLRRLHNFAVGMHWLPWPVLPKLKWPAVTHKERRAITADEHRRIIERERNPEIRAYYLLLWHLGGAQTDIAELTAGDIDWKDHTVSYQRRKTGVPVVITFGAEAAGVLESLPKFGPLFPSMARIKENHRAKMFIKRLKTVGITGISLHSYRYAWAERAKTVGMPERFAQQALGHSSKAFVRAYSVPAHAHVSDVARIDKRFIDCGGILRSESLCRLQTWYADDLEHRLTAGKLAKILSKAGTVLGSDDLDVDIEHQLEFISQFPIESVEAGPDKIMFNLGIRRTACLAEDRCKPPKQPEPVIFDVLKFNPRESQKSSGCCGNE